MTTPTGTTRVAVLDTDHHGLPDLQGLEEILLTLAYWERPDADDGDPVTDLPAPIGGGYALRALQRVLTPILDTQGERATKAGRTGSLYSPATGKGAAPAGKPVERAPLRVIELDAGDLAVLSALATALEESGHGHEAVVEAAELHFDVETWETRGDRSPYERLTTAARRLADLLTTPARFPPAEAALIEMIAAVPDGQDITLTADQHATYRSVATMLNQAALGLFGSGLAQFVALGE